MTVMTDAFKKLFLGLGGNPKELAENNDVGDYILDLEDAIKGYVDEATPSRPDYIVYYLDFSNNSTVLDFTSSTAIYISGTFNAKEYFAVENGIKRIITKNEFIAFEKSGVKCFFILKCKTYDNDGYAYAEQFVWDFIPAYVSSSNHLPNYNGSSYRTALAHGGNSSRGFGAGHINFELVNDNDTTGGNFSYYKI